MKNTLSLEHYGVAAMTTREMKTTNGGGWKFWKAVISVGIVIFAAVFASNAK